MCIHLLLSRPLQTVFGMVAGDAVSHPNNIVNDKGTASSWEKTMIWTLKGLVVLEGEEKSSGPDCTHIAEQDHFF